MPDSRDYTINHPKITPFFTKPLSFAEKYFPAANSSKPKNPLRKPSSAVLPKSIDLRSFCPPIFDQGQLGSCTANAAAGMVEYYRKRSLAKDESVSRMFIYKGTRDLMQSSGDSGAYLRTTMGALALFGAPPEKYWDYFEANLNAEPPAFCFSYAQNFQAISYFRLDSPAGTKPSAKEAAASLGTIKQTLAQGLPAMFGFTVYESIRQAKGGKIPFPKPEESVLGGHAVLCVGYNDGLQIDSGKGAFIIRNSWGENWGDKGYGYLSYDYLLRGLAQDWWALVKAEWLDTESFGI